MNNPFSSIPSRSNADTVQASWFNALRNAGRSLGASVPGAFNIGFSYSSPTFTVHGADGVALSSTNPGYIILPDKTNPGRTVTYEITANQNFIDDSGASEIVGNLFGFTTSVAITNSVPFFLYAVGNDDEDAISFMISRVPMLTTSPSNSGTQMGDPGSATATTQVSFFALEDVDLTLYNSNPCICLGSFSMKMSASDDWTVQTLTGVDGMGNFNEYTEFTMPLGQNGADASKYTFDNGGTAPIFSNNNYSYYVLRNGKCRVNISLSGDGGGDGAGAVRCKIVLPFASNNVSTAIDIGHGMVLLTNPTFSDACLATLDNATSYVQFNRPTGLANVTWANFTNGVRSIVGSFEFTIDNA